jgi:hypothetical protein
VRSALMVKLALLDRAGGDASDLLAAQREVIEPIGTIPDSTTAC